MKKISTILFLLISSVAANAQVSKPTLQGMIATDFADNTSNAITAALLRSVTSTIVSSYTDWLTCTGSGGFVYYVSGTPTCLAAGLSNTFLQGGTVPSWTALTNGNLAVAGAATIKMNPTAITAIVSDYTIQGLTNLVSPNATLDLLTIYNHTTGTLQNISPAQIASSVTSGVSSVDGYTGIINGADLNILNAQSGSYSIASTDCGKTIYMTGAMGTVTLPAVAGFNTTCVVTIKNANTTRAQLMTGFPADLNIPNVTCGGSTNFCLFPTQTVAVKIVNGSWATFISPGRWRQASPEFFANPNGNDANDCLATGTLNACKTIQHAADLACFAVDAGDSNQIVQLDDGSYSGGFQVITHCLGNNSIVVQGNPSSPQNVVIQASSGGIVLAKDKGFITLNGMTLSPLANAVTPVSCGQYANIDINGPVIITNSPGGSLFAATDLCTININGNVVTIKDNASPSSAVALYNASNNARIQLNGVMTFTGTWNFTYGCFVETGAIIDLSSGSITGGTQTGQQYLSQLNAVINGGAASKCPGNTGGATQYGGQAL